MTRRLNNWVTFSEPHITPRRNTLLKTGVDIVGMSNWCPTLRTYRDLDPHGNGKESFPRRPDHLCTCTTHSGVKKVHDWTVEQLGDLFRTTHHTKTEHVTKNMGRHCGDVQLTTYLTNTVGPVSLVLDLHIDHDRFGSSSDPILNDHLFYPNDVDKSLNDVVTDKIRKYRVDY
jgi:hypothetical protein